MIGPAPEQLVWALLPHLLGQGTSAAEPTATAINFVQTFPGVAIAFLYKDEPSGSSAALLRYDPGACVPLHRHPGYEHIYIIQGSQRDHRGHYPPGTLVINPPGTQHTVDSPEGCLVLAIWQKPVQFVDGGG